MLKKLIDGWSISHNKLIHHHKNKNKKKATQGYNTNIRLDKLTHCDRKMNHNKLIHSYSISLKKLMLHMHVMEAMYMFCFENVFGVNGLFFCKTYYTLCDISILQWFIRYCSWGGGIIKQHSQQVLTIPREVLNMELAAG